LFGDTFPSAQTNLDVLTALHGHATFSAPIAATARKLAETNTQPVFQYVLDHQGSFSFVDSVIQPKWKLALRVSLFPTELYIL
jgi:hypothetical protein